MIDLFSCIECGNSLSQKARSCPKCQTKRFKGVQCKACNGILKGSEAVSILINNESIIETSFDGEIRNFKDNFDYRDKWIEKLYPFNEYCNSIDDFEKRCDMYRNSYVLNTEIYTFHKECFDSITNLEEQQEVVIVECISCSSKIRFESYVSSIDPQDCKVCGEPNITANVIAEKNNRKTNCFNCNFPVLKSAGIEIFKFDSYLASTGYVHQVCFNEKISQKSLENKEKTIKQKKDRLEQEESRLKKQKQILEKEELERQKYADQKQQELDREKSNKIISSLTTFGILENLFNPLILFLNTGVVIVFLTKKDWLYALIGTPFNCIIIGCTPLAGELCLLLSIIHWVLPSSSPSSSPGEGYYFAIIKILISGGLFIGILIRNCLLYKLWRA
jgi:hypothetical protein